jgi:ketosteroid isomerase-like protein
MSAEGSFDAQRVGREFLEAMQACVRAVDYARARPLFADDVVAFGTYATVVTGRDRLEHNQWRNIWGTIRDFTFDLSSLHCLGSADAVCVVVAWDSTGTRPDGSTFARPGRATLLLQPRAGRWVATHSHFSLAPVRAD